jgi:hypothetical protein
MGSGLTFRRLGVAVVATAFTALVGVTAAGAATTSSGNMGASTSTTKQSRCEARADKRKLAGDQRDSYVKRCMAQVNKKHKTTASKTSAKSSMPQTQGQTQGGASSAQ